MSLLFARSFQITGRVAPAYIIPPFRIFLSSIFSISIPPLPLFYTDRPHRSPSKHFLHHVVYNPPRFDHTCTKRRKWNWNHLRRSTRIQYTFPKVGIYMLPRRFQVAKKSTLLSFEDVVPLFSTLQPLIGAVILLTEPFESRPLFFYIQAPCSLFRIRGGLSTEHIWSFLFFQFVGQSKTYQLNPVEPWG